MLPTGQLTLTLTARAARARTSRVHNKTILPVLVWALLCPACSEDTYDPNVSPRPVGTLELSWSIDGRADAAACEALGAHAFEAIIFAGRLFITEREPPCTDFATSVDLFVDDYIARTTLVDVNDFLATRRVVEDYFQINDGSVTRLSVDFPSDSAPPLTDTAEAVPGADAGVADAGLEGILP